MMMNSYFKPPEEINSLFQKASEALEQHGYDAAEILFEEAFRHDPYRLQAHYELALYFASVNNAHRFKEHLFICWNIDPVYKEKISADNAFITEFIAAKEERRWCKREFEAIAPPSRYETLLKFKPAHKKEMLVFANSLDTETAEYFIIDKPRTAPSLSELHKEPDFEKIDYCRLDHFSERAAIDCAPEKLYAALQRISPYIEDVRFLVTSEWDPFVDEVIILNGMFNIYRHPVGTDRYQDLWDYFEPIVQLYPEDRMLRHWLCREYQDDVLMRIGYRSHFGEPEEYLDNAIRLSSPEDPWMPYVLGKLALSKNETETALKYLREAAAKTSDSLKAARKDLLLNKPDLRDLKDKIAARLNG
ncbi:hypothetical protein SAMN05428988_4180 [Chitinophaga sp. YR573]|uniref:hypothetical protein n=1 Tax=Chitinophaga sp. YR573 TaxID=1881040 RepID=UPI0008D8BF8F|nr:hypothetical protein [Chitinophaga sp. YR573]SEW34650.1 hypothetical protein SAMN05428988_4180 [Chitinophaga sp. YR573]